MVPVDPFLKGFFPTSKQPTTRDVFQQLRRCCLCPGPCSHTLHGTSCWNRARRSAVFGRWVNSPRRSIGNCQLGDSLYKIHLFDYILCMYIKYTNRSGIFPKMLPAIYVGESFIRGIYPDSHQKKFTTGFHSTVVSNHLSPNSENPTKRQDLRHYLVHHQRQRLAESWSLKRQKLGPMMVQVMSMSGQTKVSWWFCRCLWMIWFSFHEKNEFLWCIFTNEYSHSSKNLGCIKTDGLKKLYCILVFWLFFGDRGVLNQVWKFWSQFWQWFGIQGWYLFTSWCVQICFCFPYLGKWSKLTNISLVGLKPPTSLLFILERVFQHMATWAYAWAILRVCRPTE